MISVVDEEGLRCYFENETELDDLFLDIRN